MYIHSHRDITAVAKTNASSDVEHVCAFVWFVERGGSMVGEIKEGEGGGGGGALGRNM